MSRIAILAAIGAVFLAPMSAYAESDIVGSWKQTAFYQKAVVLGAEEGVRARSPQQRARRGRSAMLLALLARTDEVIEWSSQ